VHPDRPADAAQPQEQLRELRLRREQLAELVDDDQEMWQPGQVGARSTSPSRLV
jgi:hypothetical protein